MAATRGDNGDEVQRQRQRRKKNEILEGKKERLEGEKKFWGFLFVSERFYLGKWI